ncbi:hypothetical protein D9611_012347 [Ephemerocybe angulata]|uniref:Uncharacterized protein n=1 Tax=Ephemerocybe angulata TaxID=980116 RepID=A0A8H5FKV4_9AGAR|nr:hypothetical protein D9611_012347 [Tulosesus angulatus]
MGSYVAPAIVVFAERTGVPLSLSAELGFGVLARLVLFVFILIAPLTPPYHHRVQARHYPYPRLSTPRTRSWLYMFPLPFTSTNVESGPALRSVDAAAH